MTLEQRIARLERRNTLLSALLVAIGVGFVSLGAHAATTGGRIPDEIVARSFRVVGEAGKNGATLSASRDGWVLLSFQDLHGNQRFGALMTPSGKVSVDWLSNKRARLDIGVTDAAEGEAYTLTLRDSAGKVIWQPPSPNPY